jgi:long-chain acyl-CoA synthetase
LIKTSGGKYVAPLHVESLILSSRFIRRAVVIGNGRRFPSALIVPDAEMLRSYAALKNISVPGYAELLKHPRIVDLIKRQIDKYTGDLPHHEKIKRFAIIDTDFSTEGGELTLTQKLRRQAVEGKYKSLIDSMYEEETPESRESSVQKAGATQGSHPDIRGVRREP